MYLLMLILSKDLLFSHGPLDVLDHSSDTFSFGGKVGVDATIKQIEESSGRDNTRRCKQTGYFIVLKSIFLKAILLRILISVFLKKIFQS